MGTENMAELAIVRKFTDRLVSTYGADLLAVVLYGSAARGDYRAGSSDLNVLVLLRKADALTLHRGSGLARDWAGAGNPPPLIMSEAEWRSSADVFPIEYTDMREHHVLLHGADPFVGIEIGWTELRLQCEHELRSKKIRLREHYLLLADDPAQLGELLKQSLPSFLTIFRTTLRLGGHPVPGESEGVVSAMASLADFDPAPLLAVLAARAEGAKPLAPGPEDEIVLGYLDAVQKAGELLDRMTATPSPRQPG